MAIIGGGGFNAYAGGSKVYNGGSSSATSGTLDPTGFIERGLTPTTSDSRSGLARMALQRIAAQSLPASILPAAQTTQPITSFPVGPLNGTAIAQNPISSFPIGVLNGVGVPPTLITSGGNPPTFQTPVGNDPTQPGQVLSPIIKPLQINNLGQIHLPSNQTLPLDSDLVSQMAAGTQAAQQKLQALQALQQQVSAGYATDARNQVNSEPGVLNQLLNSFAGRGLAHSSGYGQGVENEQDRYMQALDSLFSNSQNQLNDIVSQANGVPTTLNSLIAQLQGSQAQRNIANAGNLALNQQQADALNPDTNKQFVAVNNDIDKAQALRAGFSLDQIVNAPGSTATGLGSIPSTAQNVIFAGKAGTTAKAGSKTAVGADRNATEKLLEALRGL